LDANAGGAAGGRGGGIRRDADFHERGAAIGCGAVFEACYAVLGDGRGAHRVDRIVETPVQGDRCGVRDHSRHQLRQHREADQRYASESGDECVFRFHVGWLLKWKWIGNVETGGAVQR
jgi:hypothetical protein